MRKNGLDAPFRQIKLFKRSGGRGEWGNLCMYHSKDLKDKIFMHHPGQCTEESWLRT
jgi:hypothetical protein